MFSALEQKRVYEVKKAHICQNRVLCLACFILSHETVRELRACEQAWKENRRALRSDSEFLLRWLELMARFKQFQPYRHNFAIEAMIRKLLALLSSEAGVTR